MALSHCRPFSCLTDTLLPVMTAGVWFSLLALCVLLYPQGVRGSFPLPDHCSCLGVAHFILQGVPGPASFIWSHSCLLQVLSHTLLELHCLWQPFTVFGSVSLQVVVWVTMCSDFAKDRICICFYSSFILGDLENEKEYSAIWEVSRGPNVYVLWYSLVKH